MTDSQTSNQASITESLQRQAYKQFEFVNLCQEEILDNAVAAKKNAKRKVMTLECDPQDAIERLRQYDNIMLESKTFSVGYIVKKAAIDRYQKYFELTNTEKPIVSLGLNSILDVSLDYPNGQSLLFTKEEWLLLKYKLRSPHQPKAMIELPPAIKKLLEYVKKIAPKNPKKASTLLFRRLYNHDHSDEVEFVIFTYAYLIDYTIHHKDMFNASKPKNEQDYIVKLWSRILERLVRNSDLRLRWGESGFARIEYSSYMADVRVLVDHQDDEYEIMCAEAAKGSPSKAKFHHDHCKLLIESKDVLDNSPVAVSHIPAVQFCGHELYEFKLVHYADHFYVARKTSYAFVPPTIVDLDFCEKICKILLGLKEEWMSFKHSVEKKLKEERKACTFDSQEANDTQKLKPSPYWYPPSLTQQIPKLNPLPENLI